LDRALTLAQAARRITDKSRIIYVGSSTTGFPMPGYVLYRGIKMAPPFFVEALEGAAA